MSTALGVTERTLGIVHSLDVSAEIGAFLLGRFTGGRFVALTPVDDTVMLATSLLMALEHAGGDIGRINGIRWTPVPR